MATLCNTHIHTHALCCGKGVRRGGSEGVRTNPPLRGGSRGGSMDPPRSSKIGYKYLKGGRPHLLTSTTVARGAGRPSQF